MRKLLSCLLLPAASLSYAQTTVVGVNPPAVVGAATITQYENEQAASGWTTCNTAPLGCAGGSTGTATVTTGVSSPSLSGSAVELTAAGSNPAAWSSSTTYGQDTASTAVQVNYNGNNWRSLQANNTGNAPASGSAYWQAVGGYNALVYKHLTPCPITGNCGAISQVYWHVAVWFPVSNANLNAWEVDPDIYSHNYEYFLSFQCVVSPGAVDPATGASITDTWRLWNMGTNSWVDTPYPCNIPNQTGQWHQLSGTFGINPVNHTYTYESFRVDGVSVYSNLNATFPAAPYAAAENFNLQTQIDNLYESTPPTNSVYIDNIGMDVW